VSEAEEKVKQRKGRRILANQRQRHVRLLSEDTEVRNYFTSLRKWRKRV